MSTLLNEIMQESKVLPLNYADKQCNCHQCATTRQIQKETAFIFEVEIPASEISSELQMESITEKLLRCLRLIRNVSVRPSRKANEITMELQYDISTNKAAGDRFRNRIGIILRKCLAKAGVKRAKVQTEKDKKGGKITERVKSGTRYIDVRVLNGKKVLANIETKKGDSKYHDSQRQKDAQIEKSGRGPTYVVRNCPPGSTHPDCINKTRSISKETTLLGEILTELEI